ncbi:AraC family transcriptional regulator [Mucilaginibacter arboris]|uniref:Helix-turn-helix domain-containing protein n=1 Tax=Mucilaginibacter arboris TaxID=2682090 RepID=A0A7K1SY56_9SPHI|nr:helix-turn-helix transcriptional regulator [Mucilaginibacter arboris]MVN22254.1 helix-turn-helix domain-containing protein [Mucilaginibacter arboris]
MKQIPVYDICTLSAEKPDQEDILTDRFAAYLHHHQNLRFPHRHSFYHLVMFTSGTGTHDIDFKRFPVEAGQIYFMVPGQVHTWNFAGNIDGYIINFSDQFFQSLLLNPAYLEYFSFFSGMAEDEVLLLSDKNKQNAIRLFEQILLEYQQKEASYKDMIRSLLLELFISISRTTSDSTLKKQPKQSHLLLKNFQKLINKHFTDLKLPKEYADLLYVTPNHLNALCKDFAGKSAGELIRDRVLLEAKRLLINAELSISEIAYQLNFSDNSYFTKFFKKQTGITPEVFKKSIDHNYKYDYPQNFNL